MFLLSRARGPTLAGVVICADRASSKSTNPTCVPWRRARVYNQVAAHATLFQLPNDRAVYQWDSHVGAQLVQADGRLASTVQLVTIPDRARVAVDVQQFNDGKPRPRWEERGGRGDDYSVLVHDSGCAVYQPDNADVRCQALGRVPVSSLPGWDDPDFVENIVSTHPECFQYYIERWNTMDRERPWWKSSSEPACVTTATWRKLIACGQLDHVRWARQHCDADSFACAVHHRFTWWDVIDKGNEEATAWSIANLGPVTDDAFEYAINYASGPVFRQLAAVAPIGFDPDTCYISRSLNKQPAEVREWLAAQKVQRDAMD